MDLEDILNKFVLKKHKVIFLYNTKNVCVYTLFCKLNIIINYFVIYIFY